ncbi:MAG: hypothetical protein WBU92_05140, partial [Candidatus Dormiibacterota bacterium]
MSAPVACSRSAAGWANSRFHRFDADGVRSGVPGVDGPNDEQSETSVGLHLFPARYMYPYDVRDGWEHQVERLGSGGDQPGCGAGEGAGPEGAVGGSHGWAVFLHALAGPDHPAHSLPPRRTPLIT